MRIWRGMILLRLTTAAALLLSAAALHGDDAVKKKAVLHHSAMIHANYTDCVLEAKKMQAAIREFLAAPDAARLTAARRAWTAARQPYLQTEAYRFYCGPIDDPDGPEPMLNAWPLDEVFIDAPPGSPDPGIVGNARDYPQLTTTLLRQINQRDGEKNVACGWHAIEFLLWGPDKNPAGPGDRPFTDYTTAPHARRRGEYLAACTDLLAQQLAGLVDDWQPDELGNYRAVFDEGTDYSIERIVSALIFLSENELAGERLTVAYETKDQENEHSCFSDTTWQDHVYDMTGVQNVWRGVYARRDGTRLEGTGLREVCRAVKPELEEKISALIDASLAKAKALPGPFDQAILGDDDSDGRRAVLQLITSLEEQGASLRKLAQALGIAVPDVPPEDIEG